MVSITSEAAVRVKKLLAAQGWPEVYGLRFGLRDGGCSGFAYQFDFEPQPGDDDLVFEAHGVRIFVHPLHAPHLEGSVIGWKDSLLESGFSVENPNVKRACGCGSSFDV